jgi:MerR family transcriptional regulator, redox-sensitive transcriptional activator SoxR
MPKPTPLSIGQVADRAGVSVSTLHFYESRDLISSERSAGNQRRYGRDVLRRIAFVRAAQRVGFPLARIADALGRLPARRTPTSEDWARLALEWRSELDERIGQLQQLRNELDRCIGCGCLSLTHCRLSNPDDKLAADGAGPRRWRQAASE